MCVSYNDTVIHICENDAVVIKENTWVNAALHKSTILKSISVLPGLLQSIKTLVKSQDI